MREGAKERAPLPVVIGLLLAMGGCSPATEPGPPDASPLVREGWLLYEEGDYAGARSVFEAAIGVDGEDPEAHAGQGLTLARLGSFDAAAASLERALALAPASHDALAGLAVVEAARNAHQAVVEPATRLLVLAPYYAHPHDGMMDARAIRLLRAQAYYRLGEFRKAAADLDLLLPAAAPHSTDPQALLAALAAFSGHGS